MMGREHCHIWRRIRCSAQAKQWKSGERVVSVGNNTHTWVRGRHTFHELESCRLIRGTGRKGLEGRKDRFTRVNASKTFTGYVMDEMEGRGGKIPVGIFIGAE